MTVKMWQQTLALAVCALFLRSVQTIEVGGPTKYILEYLGHCDIETKELFSFDNYTINKYNMSTYTFSGSCVLKTYFSDDQQLNLYAAIWGNGGWKQNFFNNTISKPCTFIKNLAPSFINQLGHQIHASGCPLEPNEYKVTDLPLIITKVTVPIPHGRYKVKLVLLEGDEKLGCAESIVRIEPQ